MRSAARCSTGFRKPGLRGSEGKPAGSWATLILEQIDDMHDYYARYLPQMALAVFVPLMIVIAIFPFNWVAALILLGTAPLIPLFMAMVGMGAADANRRNFLGAGSVERSFPRTVCAEWKPCGSSVVVKRKPKTFARRRRISVSAPWKCCAWPFSLLACSNFSPPCRLRWWRFTLVSPTSARWTLVTTVRRLRFPPGSSALIPAPEFFQPLRDLGTFYHAKAQAVGAADSLKTFMETPLAHPERGEVTLNTNDPVTIEAQDFSVLSPEGKVLAGPLNFTLSAGQRVVLVGTSGSGKSSLLNALSGFMAYTGSLRINKTELRELDPDASA